MTQPARQEGRQAAIFNLNQCHCPLGLFVCVGVALVKQLFKLSNFLIRVCRNMHTGMSKREGEGKAGYSCSSKRIE